MVSAAAAPEISSERRRSKGLAEQGLQHGPPINPPSGCIAGSFWMGHQTQDIALGIGDAGDVIHRSVGVMAVPQGDGIVVLELFECVVAALISPLAVIRFKKVTKSNLQKSAFDI